MGKRILPTLAYFTKPFTSKAGAERAAAVFMGVISFISPPARADDARDACVSAFKENITEVTERKDFYALAEYMHRNYCDASSRETDAGFSSNMKALVEGVPLASEVAAFFNAKSNKQFCENYDKSRDELRTQYYRSVTQNVAGYNAINQCFDIFSRNRIVVSHVSASPDSVVIKYDFRDDSIPLDIDGVTTTGGFRCHLNQTSWLPFVKDQHIELTSTTKIHMEKDFNVICERTPKPMAGKNYFPPGTITVASSNASTYSIDMNEETVFGPALQSKAAATEKQLRAQLEAAEALAQKRKEQIETARIEIKPFIVPSGGVRPGMPPTGPDVGFYTVRNNAPEVWLGKVKQMLCPKAERVTAELVAQAPADCCGIQQYVLVCSYAETE